MVKSLIAKLSAVAVLSLSLVASAGAASNAAVDASGWVSAYVDAPAVQNSYITGNWINFDSGCPLVWPGIGTTDVACTSTGPDGFGGASTQSILPTRGGNQTNYATVWPGSPMTLTLNQPATYFGLWWSAGDGNNLLQFYSGDTLVGTFSFESLMTALQSQTLQSDGNSGPTYATQDYFGNPASGADGGEPFAYLHVFASAGKTFDKVVVTQTNGGGFEFDNVMVSFAQTASAGTLVHIAGPVEDVVVEDNTPTPPVVKPELASTGADGTWYLLSLGISGMLLASGAIALITAKRRR